VRKKVMDILKIHMETRIEKYLGLPAYVGRSRISTFAYLKGRMWAKIQVWDERLLSRAAKDVLIKACAQAIPTFAMSCFDITKSLCDQMSEMINRFWW
jgi:RNase H-fold protein (predicted Holliday junction resolvase)